MTDTKGRIDIYLQQHLDRFLAELFQLCAQPSVSARSEGTQACAELVAELLGARGFEVRLIDTPLHPVVVARRSGRSARTLMFYNHYDVQPPEPLELWISPPFEPEIRDGALYARGAKDDKGEFLARLAAVDAVSAAHGGELPCGVLFVVEGQEEIGSPHIPEFVQQHLELLACDGAIWEEGGISADGRSGNILGVRGCVGVELNVKALKCDAHSGTANFLPNAAWQLVRLLSTLKDEHEHILIDGFYDQVLPASATDRQLIEAYPDTLIAQDDAMMRETFLLDGGDYLLGRHGRELELALFEPTCNIEGITAGYQGKGVKTVIPAQASVKLDFRLVPDQDPHDILAKLRAHLDKHGFADVEMTHDGLMWPIKVSGDHPLVELTSRAAQDVYGYPALNVPLMGGSSPVHAFAGPLGNIPVVTAGVGYWDNRIHSPNEHVRIGDFHQAARQIARILDGFAGLEEPKNHT